MNNKLTTDKKVLIVGASSGIGKAVAYKFLKEGFHIGIAARRESPLKAIKDEFKDKTEYAVIDINADDAGERLGSLIERMGGVDIYIHISGIGMQNVQLDSAKELNTCQTNVVGFTRVVDYMYTYFRTNRIHGHIAVVSSIAGTKGLGVAPSYSATKRFQNTYIEALQQLTAIDKSHISFTDIRPGFVSTPLLNDDNKYPMMMQVEKVADQIYNSIKRKKSVAIIDWKYSILVCFWKLIPRIIWRKLPIRTSKK